MGRGRTMKTKMKRNISLLLACILSFHLLVGNTTVLGAQKDDGDLAIEAFNEIYWDAEKQYFYCNSDRQIHSDHAHGPEGGLYTDFWWEAQLWNMVMDAYVRSGNPKYEEQIHQVYDGFIAYYPSFKNDFNDDIAWWSLGATRAYELTGQERYKEIAKELFDRMYLHWDDIYGGGIWWKNNSQDQKNVATNGVAAMIAAKIYQMTGDETYLTISEEIYQWIRVNLSDGEGHLYDHIEGSEAKLVKWDFTYNFGVYIGAAKELYESTGEEAYLEDAFKAADWAMEYLTNSGILIDEGRNDGGGFKSVFVRQLYNLVKDDQEKNHRYMTFLSNNAVSAWNHRRPSDQLMGTTWSGIPEEGHIQSLTAASGVIMVNLVSTEGYTGVIDGNGLYEAENEQRRDISTESKNDVGGQSHSGRGYLAGWNKNGSYVKFHLNVKGGEYNITLKYAAGAGDARRKILLNEEVYRSNQLFSNTGDWGTWEKVVLHNVNLKEGYNTLTIIQDDQEGNSNWLNLDYAWLQSGSSVVGKDPFNRIEAEDYDVQQGLIAEECSEGGRNIGGITEGDYTMYSHYAFTTTPSAILVRGASDTEGGTVEVRLDSLEGPVVATVAINNTGGWQDYQDFRGEIQDTMAEEMLGDHDLYLVYKGPSYLFNLNWFRFE